MPTENDPLAEDDGPCTRCEHGYITVRPKYAEHLYPDPTAEQLAGLDTDATEALWRNVEGMRAAARNSVYPCRRCLPAMFWRWANGHLAFGHDVLGCDECIELLGGKRAARRAARALEPATTAPPRKDLD